MPHVSEKQRIATLSCHHGVSMGLKAGEEGVGIIWVGCQGFLGWLWVRVNWAAISSDHVSL